MRVARITLLTILLMMAGLVSAEAQVGIFADRLQDPKEYYCPICKKLIRPGHIGLEAEAAMIEGTREALAKAGFEYVLGRDEAKTIGLFVFRFEERRGSAWSVERPAGAGFHAHLFRSGNMIKVFEFNETQQTLLENVLKLGTFLNRGGRWITASELAREGIDKAIELFQEDLK
jgi:hypothetical protein